MYVDIIKNPKAAKIARPYFEKYVKECLATRTDDRTDDNINMADHEVELVDTTIRNALNGSITYNEMQELIDKLNG